MDIIPINDESPHFSTVKTLWRVNSATLGFFPDGAFVDHAKLNRILVSIDSKENCIGYLIYRISNMYVTIVHLCVDASCRETGVSKALVNYLKKITTKFDGIGLWCRRDFDASKVWPKLGFVALNDKRGRSFSGEYLTYWWFDHGHRNLLTLINENRIKTKIKAVIDANVFYDLYWDDLQKILVEEEGRKSQIQSPLHISNQTFKRLYSLGVEI